MSDFILEWFPIIFGFGVLIALGWFITVGVIRHVRERRKRRERAQRLSRPPGHFVFAKIMDPVGPMERGDKYEEPLDRDLEAQGLGMVTGGGTQMGKDGGIEWVGIDIDLADLDRGIEFTRHRLRELGAPAGSVLEYRIGEQKMTVQIA
jgi:hypothetical protein